MLTGWREEQSPTGNKFTVNTNPCGWALGTCTCSCRLTFPVERVCIKGHVVHVLTEVETHRDDQSSRGQPGCL